MRIAACDLGSNTFLMTIAECNDGKIQKVLADECEITRLGQGVNETKEFHSEALQRAEDCFRKYQSIIQEYEVDVVRAVATSAARDVKNREEFLSLAGNYSIPVEVISGAEEANLTFKGAISGMPKGHNYAVIDVGGGSTEIISGNLEPRFSTSIDIGSVRLTEMFIKGHPIADNVMEVMEKHIVERIQENISKLNVDDIDVAVAVAGTPTTLAAVIQEIDFDHKLIEGFSLSLDQIKNWIRKLALMTIEERVDLTGMPKQRADVIVAGACILFHSLEALKMDSLRVSTKGVRYGIIENLARTVNE